MNRRKFFIGTASAAAVGTTVAAGCAVNNGGVNVGPFKPSPDYTLSVGYTDSTIAGYRLRTRTYNGSTTGPTLTTSPGSTLRVRIVNQLPPNPPAAVPQGQVRIPLVRSMADMHGMRGMTAHETVLSAKIDPMNNPHLFNTTNLHVHGLQTGPHIFEPVGTSNPSAMMIAIDPGTTYDYAFPLPPDHPSGLYWYHPHHHGSTDVQVSGGMAGLIVVRGAIDRVPEIAAAREILMAVQSLNVNKSPNDGSLYQYEPVAYQPPPVGYNLGTDFTLFTVNGTGVNFVNNTTNVYTQLPLPQFQMRPGEVVRLRLLNGTNSNPLPLALPGMKVYLIGLDGINLSAPQLIAQNSASVVTAATLFDFSTVPCGPANRAEMLIVAPQTPGTFTLTALANNGVVFQPFPAIALAQFVVSGAPVSMNLPTSLPQPPRVYPLIADSDIAARRRIVYSEGPSNVLLTGFGFFTNNTLYDEMDNPIRPRLNSAEEWTIVNTSTEMHPFHIHETSFQIMSINGQTPPAPVFWDTMMIPPQVNGVDGTVVIRMRFVFAGKSVHHCHVLPHEDTGMMQNFLVG